jgi:hypothetical protein
MSDRVDEPCVRDAHHGQVDPQIQEEVQDVPAVDLTHTGQPEEIGHSYWRLHWLSRLQRLTGGWSTYFQDQIAWMRMHSLAVRMTIARVWIHLYGIQAQMIVAGAVHKRIQLLTPDTV